MHLTRTCIVRVIENRPSLCWVTAEGVTASSRFPPTRWQWQSTTCGAVVSGGGGLGVGGVVGCGVVGRRRLMFSCCAVSTTAGRRQAGGGCARGIHRNGPWGHFSVWPCGSVAVWWHLASNYYRRRDIYMKNTPICMKIGRRICCCPADKPVKFQSHCWTLTINVWASRFHGILG